LGKSHNGGAYRSFGYDREWNVLEEEAALLRDAYVRVAAGESVASIVKAWNDKGIHTSAGNPWRRRTLQTMLQRPAYAGLSSYKGEVVGKTEHDAIVDEALWQAAQDMMDSRTEAYQGNPGRNGRVWLLSGIAVCGSCKMPMYGSSSKGGVYRCVKADGGCGSMRMKATWLEFIAQEEAARMAAASPPKAAPRHDYAADVEAIDKRIQALREANDRGDLDLADLIPLLKAERSKRADVLRQAQTQEHPIVDQAMARMTEWKDGSISARRVLVSRYIKALVVNPSQQPGRRVFDPSRVTLVEQSGKSRVAKTRKPPKHVRGQIFIGVTRIPIENAEHLARLRERAAKAKAQGDPRGALAD
jgi:hypothetical protein